MPLDTTVAETGSHLLHPGFHTILAGADVTVRQLAARRVIRSIELSGIVGSKESRLDLLQYGMQNLWHFRGDLLLGAVLGVR
jgi:hypothetical protein